MSRWKKKGSREVGKSSIFSMVEDRVVMPDGTERDYTIVDFPDFAGVLPIYEDKFVMIRNYRYPVDLFVLEIPAGLIDPGEEPEEAAKRELEEETGFVSKGLKKLCTYHPAASLNTQKAHIYLGRAVEGGRKKRDPGEDMESILMSIDDVYGMLDAGEISHPPTMVALFYARDIVGQP